MVFQYSFHIFIFIMIIHGYLSQTNHDQPISTCLNTTSYGIRNIIFMKSLTFLNGNSLILYIFEQTNSEGDYFRNQFQLFDKNGFPLDYSTSNDINSCFDSAAMTLLSNGSIVVVFSAN